MDPEFVLLAGPEGLAFAQLDLVLQKGGSLFLEKENNFTSDTFCKSFYSSNPQKHYRFNQYTSNIWCMFNAHNYLMGINWIRRWEENSMNIHHFWGTTFILQVLNSYWRLFIFLHYTNLTQPNLTNLSGVTHLIIRMSSAKKAWGDYPLFLLPGLLASHSHTGWHSWLGLW